MSDPIEVVFDAGTGETTTKSVDPLSLVAPEIAQAEVAQAAQNAANALTIGQQVEAALASNATYLVIASPGNAQVIAQVRALTRQCNGVIRLLRSKLDATS